MRIQRFLRSYSGLDRSIYFLCLAQVVNSIGHFVHPFLTMFLTRKFSLVRIWPLCFVLSLLAAGLLLIVQRLETGAGKKKDDFPVGNRQS